MKRASWIGVSLVTSVLCGAAFAGPRDFVVVQLGAGIGDAQAQGQIDRFLRVAEKRLGWPEKSTTGVFISDPAEAVKHIEDKKPGFALLSVEVLVGLRAAQKEPLTVIASAVAPKLNLGKMHLVVKDPAYKSLDDLKGKTLTSNHLEAPRFVAKVVFDGKIDPATYFGKLVQAPGLSAGLKAVDRGSADAVLVSDPELASVKKMYPNLRPIWSSAEMPPMALVALTKNAKPKDTEAFKKMVIGLCSDPEGAALCKDLEIEKFTAPDEAAYQAAQKKFDK